MDRFSGAPVQIFSTCPQPKATPRSRYLQEVADVARWSEDAGCAGILVYTDNSIVDPWLVSQVILQSTERLAPLVATQPRRGAGSACRAAFRR
jgi:alkanesulfonate monooxygenase